MNSTPYGKSKNNQDNSKTDSNDKSYDEHLKRDVKCFHCGERSHVIDECDFYKKGKPQTPSGARVFAEFNKLRGTNVKYDPERILESRNKKKNIMLLNSRREDYVNLVIYRMTKAMRMELRERVNLQMLHHRPLLIKVVNRHNIIV